MNNTFSLSRAIVGTDDFRCLSVDAQATFLQCCAYADEKGVIKDYWLIGAHYFMDAKENPSEELIEGGYVEEINSDGTARTFRVKNWCVHKGNEG